MYDYIPWIGVSLKRWCYLEFMKKLNIFLIILCILFIIIAFVVWWQFDNIKSVYYSFKYNNEQIDSLIDKHYGEVDKYLKEHSNYNVRPSTEVEQKLHQDELLTDKEFQNVLTGKNDVNKMFGTQLGLDESKNFIDSDGNTLTKEELEDAKNENAEEDDADENDGNDEKAAESIAKMYVLKSTFEAKLEALYNEAVAYYHTLSSEQKKNAKAELLKKFYSTAADMERSCDAEVDKILTDLEATLKKSGESTELIAKIKTAYTEEKSLKKAYYLNLHK